MTLASAIPETSLGSPKIYKKLHYRRGTSQRRDHVTCYVEILPSAAQLYEKSHLKRLAVGE